MSDKVPKLLARLSSHYRVDSGRGFSLKDFDPDDHGGLDLKDLSDELLAESIKVLSRAAGAALRPGPLVGAADLPGARRRRQGRHHQARDVGPQPAGLRGAFVQGPVGRRARPRLPVAHDRQAATARPHRHLQPFVLRGGAGRPRASGDPGAPAAAGRAGHQEDLEASASRTSTASSAISAGRASSSASSSCTCPRTSRSGASSSRLDEPEKNWKFSLGDVHEREHFDDYHATPTRTRSAHRDTERRRGTSSPPTASGSRGWWSPRRSSRRIESIDPALPRGQRRGQAAVAGGAHRARRPAGEGPRPAGAESEEEAREMSGDGLIDAGRGRRRCAGAATIPSTSATTTRSGAARSLDDRRLFEKICLEGFQAGLSWLTILRKRERFREAFAGFDPARVARFGARDVDASARGRRASCATAARSSRRSTTPGAPSSSCDEFGSLAAYVWTLGAGAERPAARADLGGAAGDADDAGVGRALQGPQEARLDVRRSDDGLRVHAGDGPGQRPPRGLLRACASVERRCGGASSRPAPAVPHIWSRVNPAAPSSATRPSGPSRWAPPTTTRHGCRLGRARFDRAAPSCDCDRPAAAGRAPAIRETLQQQPLERGDVAGAPRRRRWSRPCRPGPRGRRAWTSASRPAPAAAGR